jgi:hypothetical protein
VVILLSQVQDSPLLLPEEVAGNLHTTYLDHRQAAQAAAAQRFHLLTLILE